MKVVDPKRIQKGWKIALIGAGLWGLSCMFILYTYIIPKEVLFWMLPIWFVGILFVSTVMIIQGTVKKSVPDFKEKVKSHISNRDQTKN